MRERPVNRRRLRMPRPQPKRDPRNRRRVSPAVMLERAALVLAAGAALWTAFHTPQLRVRRVEVEGADRLGARRVAELASIPLGRNIFRVNLYRARVAVEQDPLVHSATVTRALPNTVRVRVRERAPVFVIAQGSRYFEADAAGMLFRQVPQPTPKLPILALENVAPARLGHRLPGELMKPALACLRLTARDRMLLWKIRLDGPTELWLNVKVSSRPNGLPMEGMPGRDLSIRLGRPEELSLKLEDARKILAGRPQVLEGAQYLDVSCAGRPVYMALSPTRSSANSPQGASGQPVPALPATH